MNLLIRRFCLITFLSLPLPSIGQSITLDELIKIQKLNPSYLEYVSTALIPNKLERIESIAETEEDFGRVVWKTTSNALITSFFGNGIMNRVLLQTENYPDHYLINERIEKLGMKVIDEKEEDGIFTYTYLGINYVIIQIVATDYIKPSYVYEIYKKEDYFKNKSLIENYHKVQNGDTHLGGLVYSVDFTGKHGSLITPFDVASNVNLNDAYQKKYEFLLSGYNNQGKIGGWKIPSVANLLEVHRNLSKTGLVQFENKFFWTDDIQNHSGGFATVVNLMTGEQKKVISYDNNSRYSLILIKHF